MLRKKGEQNKSNSCPNWGYILLEDTDKKMKTIFTICDLLKCYEVSKERILGSAAISDKMFTVDFLDMR